jgi:hypothetical protein
MDIKEKNTESSILLFLPQREALARLNDPAGNLNSRMKCEKIK